MSERTPLADIADAQQAEGPVYYEHAETQRAVRLALELAEELCVLRDRLDTADRLAARGETSGEAAIDAFEVGAELQAERLSRHRAFYQELLTRLRGA